MNRVNRVLTKFLAIVCFAAVSFGITQTATAYDTVEIAKQKIARGGGVYVVDGKPEFFAKNHAGKTKSLNLVWRALQTAGVSLNRIDVVREGESTVLFSYSPGSGLVSR